MHTEEPLIRCFEQSDADCVAELSIRAWDPVFDSMRQVLGNLIFLLLYPSWVDDQADAVRTTCAQQANTTWVAEAEAGVVGFVVVNLHENSPIGEIEMIAVDPVYQRRGIGRALTNFAVDRIKDAGKTVAMISTGGDQGHVQARRMYSSAGFTLRPIARYFKAL